MNTTAIPATIATIGLANRLNKLFPKAFTLVPSVPSTPFTEPDPCATPISDPRKPLLVPIALLIAFS